jgi:EREBP-like factor
MDACLDAFLPGWMPGVQLTGAGQVRLRDPQAKRSRHIGSFASEEDAARACDRAVVQARGSGAKRNFPGEATATSDLDCEAIKDEAPKPSAPKHTAPKPSAPKPSAPKVAPLRASSKPFVQRSWPP